MSSILVYCCKELIVLNEMQEGVAIEIAEAVVGALKGELAATAVNAPMVPAEVFYKICNDCCNENLFFFA